MDMKKGDKVFHFNGKQIIEGVCKDVFQIRKEGYTFVLAYFPIGSVNDPYHLYHGQYFPEAILGEDVFDSKENLQKYYLQKLEIS